MTPTIQLRNATLSYQSRVLFAGLELHLEKGQWTALLGPSGVGKSSLLRLIAGLASLECQMSGDLQADNGIPVAPQVAYMAQTDLLLPWLNVLDNVTLGCRLRRTSRPTWLAQREKAQTLLTQVGLADAIHLFPNQLSGGMRQRAALVRTLLEDKPVVLMDEPFSALDAITRYKLQALAVELLRDKTVLFITHDPSEALRLGHHLYILQGYPATLNLVAQLTTQTPRAMQDPDVMHWQNKLFQALSGGEHESVA